MKIAVTILQLLSALVLILIVLILNLIGRLVAKIFAVKSER